MVLLLFHNRGKGSVVKQETLHLLVGHGSGSCKLVGPCGEVDLAEGVMAAKRHLHIIPEDAAQIGVKDKQIVKLSIKSEERSLIFDDVIARVSPTCATRVHLDTDEANAAGISGEVEGEIIL